MTISNKAEFEVSVAASIFCSLTTIKFSELGFAGFVKYAMCSLKTETENFVYTRGPGAY